MPQPNDIAVIIPCFNHANVLRRTLEALQKQTIAPSEIVVVDDGSTDQPFEVVKQVFPQAIEVKIGQEKEQAAVRFIRQENQGAPVARNAGAGMTRSPLIIFLDADAELVPTALEEFLRALEENPEAEYAYANFRWGRRLFTSRTFDPDMLKKANYIHTSSLIRRSAFPGFDPSLKKFQDWDLWLTMAKQGKPGFWIDKELYRVEPRRRGTGMSTWLPSFIHKLPWPIFGWMPTEIRRYRAAEQVIKQKHQL